MVEGNFSFLVYENNIKAQIQESCVLVNALEEQKRKLRTWAERVIEKQDKLIEKVRKIKHQLKIEASQRVKLEEYIKELEEKVPKGGRERVGYSVDTQEEVVMNTNKMLKKIKENPMIEEIFLLKTDYNKVRGLVQTYKLDQAYIKVVQFLCEMIECTSSLPNEDLND